MFLIVSSRRCIPIWYSGFRQWQGLSVAEWLQGIFLWPIQGRVWRL